MSSPPAGAATRASPVPTGRGCGIARLWPDILAARDGGPAPDLDRAGLTDLERALLDAYLDFLTPGRGGLKVLAHLGQSLDGRIATASGHSTFVTGEANLVHMHRLRALADAVLVGAGTVAADDPQLTVRLVAGRSPLRVVLDTRRRLQAGYRVFTDAPPATIVLCAGKARAGDRLGRAEIHGLNGEGDGSLCPSTVLAALRGLGIRRLFIEGGGITVSRFLAAGCLDRLQLCIAPVIIGSGREALRLPSIETMQQALRLDPVVLPMGSDRLYLSALDRIGPAATRSVGQEQDVLVADARSRSAPLDRSVAS